MGLLSVTIGFHEFSQHVHVVPCHSVATMRNIISAALFALNSVVIPWTKGLLAAKTGWKPNKNTAQGSALGNSELSILRSERAKGRNERVFRWFLLRLQRASLFIHPYPRRCLGLYSFWGFAPSLLKCNLSNYLQLRPAFDRNHICRNTRYFLCSLGVLSDTTEFHAFSRHVRIGSCYSVATIKIFVRCIVTGCEVETRIFL